MKAVSITQENVRHQSKFNPFSAGVVFRRQILMSRVDPRTE